MDTPDNAGENPQNLFFKHVENASASLLESFGLESEESRLTCITSVYVNLENAGKYAETSVQSQLSGLMGLCLALVGKQRLAKETAEHTLQIEPCDPGATLTLLEIALYSFAKPSTGANLLSGLGRGYADYGLNSRDLGDNLAGMTLGLLFGGIGALTKAKKTESSKRTVHDLTLKSAKCIAEKLGTQYYVHNDFLRFVFFHLLSRIEVTSPLKINYKDVFQILYDIPLKSLGFDDAQTNDITDLIRQLEIGQL